MENLFNKLNSVESVRTGSSSQLVQKIRYEKPQFKYETLEPLFACLLIVMLMPVSDYPAR